MARIFAYIVHKAGVADDSAAELAAAAKKIDACCVSHGCCYRLGSRSLTPFAKACVPPTARFGKSRMKPLPIPMPNWSAKPW